LVNTGVTFYMPEIEGVIKYHCHHRKVTANPQWDLSQINTWRSIMHQLELIGQRADRYLGYGYGNISQRTQQDQFIISGTQTGELTELKPEQYCLVEKVDINANLLYASGPCKPSSEALTHAGIYKQSSSIQCIIHAHSPEIWQATQALQLPYTAKGITYGTPEMATAVEHLFYIHRFDSLPLFTLLGHKDGIIAFGSNFTQAGCALITTLASAKQRQYQR